MSTSPAEGRPAQRFSPTSGVVSGWLGVGLATIMVGSVVLGDHTRSGLRFALAAAGFGLLLWCFMLRPRLVIGDAELELRNPFSSWHIPLAEVRRVSVRAVTQVFTGDERRFDGVAIGRPARSLVRGGRPPSTRLLGMPGRSLPVAEEPTSSRRSTSLTPNAMADFVTEQILHAADRARSAPTSPGVPRRSWAWPEIVVLAVLAVALVLSLLL